ncbi:hypothetical protein B0H14DRAFT_2976467, partial [Mycena olivaceomarginata]
FALVPALGLMQFLFLAFILSPRAQQRDCEAEAEVGRGAKFFQMQSPACAATARSSLLKMVVMRRRENKLYCVPGRYRREARTRRLVGNAHPTRCRSPSPSRSRSCQAWYG